MFGRALLLLGCMAAVLGCARPKYETVEVRGQDGSGSQKITDCALHFQNSGLCVLSSWEKLPTTSEAGTLLFKIARPNLLDGSPVVLDLQGEASVILWMPGMGHGSSPTTVTRLDVGTYRVSGVFFVMPGQWEIRFQIKEGNAVKDEAVMDFIL